ncbi:MAG: class I SAM-dependent methyltransferase [Burkholderiales bacterium]|nr:class I SAM-dependent methyltransferase [Burkholderiales bacterium]
MTQSTVSNYGWTSGIAPESTGYIGPKVVELLRQLRTSRVLDLGCGNGALCGELSRLGFVVAGMEVDPEGVRIARENYASLPIYQAGVYDDPASLMRSEQPFDAVVSTEVIEHLFAPHLLPRYARQVLKPGGYLVLSTPYHGYIKNLALSVFGQWDKHFTALWYGGHIKFWSRHTLERLLLAEGFESVAFHGVGRMPYLWKSMVVVARRSPSP